jgi:hypothetical protein
VSKPGGRNIASAVRETLDSVVSPSVRDTILARALTVARMNQVPTEVTALGDFVQGPLHDSLVRSLGPELGLSVTTELERVVALATPLAVSVKTEPPPARKPSTRMPAPGNRRPSRTTMPSRDAFSPGSVASRDGRWAENEFRAISPTEPAAGRTDAGTAGPRSKAPTRRGAIAQPASADFPAGTATALGVIGTASVEPSPAARPMVYVASTDSALLRSFQEWLENRAVVVPVSGVRELIAHLDENDAVRSVIVLDGKNPALRPLVLAALAEEMDDRTQVLLWGIAPHLHAKMRTISSATEKWLVYGSDATTTELVARCAKLVG